METRGIQRRGGRASDVGSVSPNEWTSVVARELNRWGETGTGTNLTWLLSGLPEVEEGRHQEERGGVPLGGA